MGRPTYAWQRSGWLPDFEVVECPRIAEWRERHEAAIAAVEEAGIGAARYEADDTLFAVVEDAFRDLAEHFDAVIGGPLDEAIAKVTPKDAGEPRQGMLPMDASSEEAREQGRKEAKERARLRPLREAFDRDERAVARLRTTLYGGSQQALYRGDLIPVVLAQVAEVRDEAGAVAVP